MCEPTTYKQWKQRDESFAAAVVGHPLRNHPRRTPEEAIKRSAEWLIQRLYYPHPELASQTSHLYQEQLGVHGLHLDAINWGDLHVVEVTKTGKVWIVEIQEATPDSEHLCEYIRSWLEKWGWTPVVVRTEW